MDRTRGAVLLLLIAVCARTALIADGRGSDTKHRNITKLLDSLLRGYNKHLRPDFGVEALKVTTNILIRSMGPVVEEDMMFSMDCYFRQTWTDARLSFEPYGNITELRPSVKMLHEIWKPDTFFLNGHDSYLHVITSSNRLFRIQPSGKILYSQRLTIKSACPMNLRNYPLDTQECPLLIGSYGYGDNEILYEWAAQSEPVKKYKDITMSQFTLTKIDVGERVTGTNHGGRIVLFVKFELRREIGFYLLQIYLPCYLIVIISWVSFWINREAAPARVTLGITTLLTTCTIGLTGRAGIPKVAYSTALDIFILLCFFFVFAAIVEYAGVNYFTKGEQKDFVLDVDTEVTLPPCTKFRETFNVTQDADAPNGDDVTKMDSLARPTAATDDELSSIPAISSNTVMRSSAGGINGGQMLSGGGSGNYDNVDGGPSSMFVQTRSDTADGRSLFHSAMCQYVSDCICTASSTATYRYDGMKRAADSPHVTPSFDIADVGGINHMNSVSRIDILSRVMFPFAFACLNVLYWSGFIYYF